jgi:gliding motility-associated lipoprotein GldD
MHNILKTRPVSWAALLILGLLSCVQVPPTPKPRAYPKIQFPEKSYTLFTERYCPFSFEMPQYARIEQDTQFFEDKPLHPCWFDIYFPVFDCRIHCSYFEINNPFSFEKLNEDAFRMVMEHNRKATYIDELPIEKPGGINGFLFNIEGPAATPFQFYLSDSSRHFLRGALYFNSQIKPDSLAPQYEFVKRDIVHLINTFHWK